MRLLVCGSAHRVYRDLVYLELQRLHAAHRITVLVHGGLGGVCVAAEDWARQADVPIVRYPPNWVCHRKRAEAVRNRFMLHDARPDMVAAFPGGPHTADLVRCALGAGLAVYTSPDRDVPRAPPSMPASSR